MASTAFQRPPPQATAFSLSFPTPGVLVVTINRAKRMNSLPMAAHHDGQAIWDWLDDEPSLIVAVITGSGTKAFCAGADLLEQRDRSSSADPTQTPVMPAGGFGGLSRRVGKKPVIAAVNGHALGGGFEICLNCDVVVASPSATFSLPEVERGLYAGAGGLSRIVRQVGMLVASEMALTGRSITAQDALSYNLVNRISESPDNLMVETLDIAKKIASLSPDAVIVTRAGLRESWETASVERASALTADRYGRALAMGENMRIGLEAFARKQQPEWVDSKL